MSDIAKRCEGRWHDLLLMLGVDRRFLTGRHGPCPMCGGRDRFRFDNKRGRGTYFCNQCGAGDGIKLLMKFKGWDFKTFVYEVEEIIGKTRRQVTMAKETSESQRAAVEKIWSTGRPVSLGPDQPDPAANYLRNRGICTPRLPATLRFAERCWHKGVEAEFPALLARVDAPNGTLCQVHKTYLTDAGEKAPIDPVRLFHWGQIEDGAAVRIGQANGRLGIAEGIETAISAALIFKMPVWAALNASMLQKWAVPDGVEEVHVFGDNDENFTGQSAAYALANRLSMQLSDSYVTVHLPETVGDDWNDVYRRRQGR